MSTNNASRIKRSGAHKRAGAQELGAGAEPDPPAIRRSDRISNKVVKSAKGTCGKAVRDSLLTSPDASPADQESHYLGQTSIPVVSKKSSEAVDGIIYVKETNLQQYVRVTIRDHTVEDISVFPF